MAEPKMNPDDLANPAIERLAEDESLRGDLTDDGFLPLQNWAFARLQAIAAEAVRYPHPEKMMDVATETIRTFVRDAVAAAQNSDAGDLAGEIRPRIVPRAHAAAIQSALHAATLGSDADANAQEIAKVLSTEY